MSKKALCAILCYNNEKIIQKLIDDLSINSHTLELEKIFIDDGSTDRTFEILTFNKVNILRHDRNIGYGGAVKSGINYALRYKYDYLLIFPGDYQRYVDDLILMKNISLENNYDLISGSKFKKMKLLPWHRKIGNIFYSKLAKNLWSSKIEDVLSGFKSYKVIKFREIIKNLPDNYSFDIVLNQIISKKNFKSKEFDADVKYNDQTSKMKNIFKLEKKNILMVGLNMLICSIKEMIKLNSRRKH